MVALQGLNNKIAKRSVHLLILNDIYEKKEIIGSLLLSRDFTKIWGNLYKLNGELKELRMNIAAPATNKYEVNEIGKFFLKN